VLPTLCLGLRSAPRALGWCRRRLTSQEEPRRLFLNAEIKRADISYEELAARLKGHGINEFHVTFLAFRHATLTKVGP
jgi:hypothetical protein